MPYVTEANLTDLAVERWSDIPDPRLRQVMRAAIKHLHAFVREVEPTPAEWFAAIDWLTRTGQMCDAKRQEFILASDVMGVSMLVDAINNRLASGATPSTVEGPFHIPNSDEFADGQSMSKDAPGIPCVITGTVRDLDGKPVGGALLDLWQTDGEGLYEAQRDRDQYMRGVYHSNPDGTFTVRTVAPIGYTIPMDGPVGELMNRTNISHMRPAHIHFHVAAPGYKPVITHLFQKGDQYIETDVVFGVKEPLIVEFHKKGPGKAPNGETMSGPWYDVKYDFVLQKATSAQKAA
ncbi:MAG: hydroxyquinol 1,2-dioxygenase [Pseudorhodoplanes sp.]|nr:Hydroxyquinol 1,2-dioxygenase [Pseudorhodoplanes sp.]MBW7948965.1 catechol 1,2-dioxygenase [Pseudorhodoplanes sp.]MCL4710633.1 hydroxyquinol 1,2-dioxygenase [Pseudorhodoplanes sp.]MCQ3942899.1 catechol 1,2-dioxygenase [Alphaproteobacteria bacterium]GIK82024.1 MAG: catechol 1,2-dioxygenase [Alphaproteobacteria bacterium]